MSDDATISKTNRILGGLWGSLVGDALGVPVEFKSRDEVRQNPVTDMRGFGTHRQPKGTWSDDGALILCTVDSLVNFDFDTADMGGRFVRWMNNDLWTATGETFDVGNTTADALLRVGNGTPAEEAGGRDEYNNGNGSLMRIIPLPLCFTREPVKSIAQRIERVSRITHGHDRSTMGCVLYGLVVSELLRGAFPQEALEKARKEFAALYRGTASLPQFERHLEDRFVEVPVEEIVSTGYILHTLYASLWCLLTTHTYEQCVLKAVNLGGDTDTTGCVAGGLAGVAYGLDGISGSWRDQLPRKNNLTELFQKFVERCERQD